MLWNSVTIWEFRFLQETSWVWSLSLQTQSIKGNSIQVVLGIFENKFIMLNVLRTLMRNENKVIWSSYYFKLNCKQSSLIVPANKTYVFGGTLWSWNFYFKHKFLLCKIWSTRKKYGFVDFYSLIAAVDYLLWWFFICFFGVHTFERFHSSWNVYLNWREGSLSRFLLYGISTLSGHFF